MTTYRLIAVCCREHLSVGDRTQGTKSVTVDQTPRSRSTSGTGLHYSYVEELAYPR